MSKNLYHEIKNHLSVCDLYVEIIKKKLDKKGILDTDTLRAINTIKNSLEAIGLATNDLRAQVNEVNFSTVNFYSLTEDVYSASVAYINDKNIELINALPSDFELQADKNKMFSVLVNLVKNAIEAINSKGYVKIYANGNTLFIENNGEIISRDIAEKIFQDGFTTKNYGDGIGLAFVKKILNMQGFEIHLNSSTANKTVFSINFEYKKL